MGNTFESMPVRKNEEEQLDLFYENNPEVKEKSWRVKFNVSILGGNSSKEAPDTEEVARNLGHDLVKKWYSIQTGGYAFGTMKAALEGGNEALQEMNNDPNDKKLLGMFNPVVKGITAEGLKPLELAVKGDKIKNEVAEGPYDVYLRLGKLMEDCKVCVILPGSFGTENEVMANLAFSKFKSVFGIATKPVIFVGRHFDALLSRFTQENKSMDNIYMVESEGEALELVNQLSKKGYMEKNSQDTAELQLAIDSKKYL